MNVLTIGKCKVKCNIKELAIQKGLKANWIAKQIGVSVSTMSDWCASRYLMNSKNVNKVCELLDCSLIDLYTIEELN